MKRNLAPKSSPLCAVPNGPANVFRIYSIRCCRAYYPRCACKHKPLCPGEGAL